MDYYAAVLIDRARVDVFRSAIHEGVEPGDVVPDVSWRAEAGNEARRGKEFAGELAALIDFDPSQPVAAL